MATTATAGTYSPPGPFPVFPLGYLPNEIVHMVFEQLKHEYLPGDIARLRLVCKRFAVIGSYYILSEAHLFLKSSQFERLRQISEHPIISKKVDSLFYEADSLDDYGSIQEWKRNICDSGWMSTLSPASQFDSPASTAREERAHRRSLNKAMQGPKYTHSETLLRRAYDNYAGHVAYQESMRRENYNIEMLKDALMKMPNVKNVRMSTQLCLGRSIEMEQAFKDGLLEPYGDRQSEEGCGVGQLRSLLLAADATDLKFETLAAGYVDWRFFRESCEQNQEVLRKMQRSVRALRTLKLYITTITHPEDEFFLINPSHHMVPEGAQYLHETSHLKDFITATPDLERLDINFDYDEPCPPATLCDTIGTFKWHSLRVAAFAVISADEDCMAQFFVRHAGTLRKLRLEAVLLTTGSWPSLLRRARRSLMLEQASLSGRLKSQNPEEEFYFDFTAGLNLGKRAKIEVVVEEYLLKGGEGPLLDLRALVDEHYNQYVDPVEDLPIYVDVDSDEFIMDRF